MLEFLFAGTVFFLLIISIFDFSYVYLYKMELQNAVRQAGRYAITGQAMSGSEPLQLHPAESFGPVSGTRQLKQHYRVQRYRGLRQRRWAG